MRSASESSFCVVPVWGTQVLPLHRGEKELTGMLIGPTNVDALGFEKFGDSWYWFSVVVS